MRALVSGLFTLTLLFGCQLDPKGEGDDDDGGSSGSSGTTAGSSTGQGGASGSDAGSGPNAGRGGNGNGGSSSGGKAQAGGSGGGKAGSGGSDLGGAGSGGSGTQGGSANGGAGSPNAGSGGCTENIRCTLEALPSTGDVHQDCVDRINQFRTECACLPALERWTEGEDCADQMAEYDSTADEAHAGFRDEICEGGSGQNECPGWRSETQVVEGCLQQMWDEGPPPQDPCEGDCFQEHGHFINMTNSRYTRVACGFYTTPDDRVWSVQNFSR